MLYSGNHFMPPSTFHPLGIRKLTASILLMPGSLTLSRANFSESRADAGGAATAGPQQRAIAIITNNTSGTRSDAL